MKKRMVAFGEVSLYLISLYKHLGKPKPKNKRLDYSSLFYFYESVLAPKINCRGISIFSFFESMVNVSLVLY